MGRFTEPALVIGNQRRVGLLELEGEQAIKAILKTDSAAELDSVAADVTRDLVAKLTGRQVSSEDAKRAVKAAANG